MSREIEEIRAEGYAKGRAKGYAKEYAEEYAEGYVEGYTEGYALEEKKEMANRLNDFGLPVEQIAQALNADVSMVQEWLAEPQLPKEQWVGRKDKNSEILASFIEVRIFFRIFLL